MITLDEGIERGTVAQHLRSHGVQCNFGTYASHLQPVYDFHGELPVSENLFGRHLAIPMHANLSGSDVDRVVEVLDDALTAR